MSRSIIQHDCTICFLCGRNGSTDHLEKHHIFGGNPNRSHSEEDGLYVFLCGNQCHRTGMQAVHRDRDVMDALHMVGQRAFERKIGSREDFMKRYGRNYLDEYRDFDGTFDEGSGC